MVVVEQQVGQLQQCLLEQKGLDLGGYHHNFQRLQTMK